MGKAAELVFKEALDLSERERAKLVEDLLAILEPERDDDIDTAWAQEIEKRALEISQGTVVPIMWEEVKATALKRVHEA